MSTSILARAFGSFASVARARSVHQPAYGMSFTALPVTGYSSIALARSWYASTAAQLKPAPLPDTDAPSAVSDVGDAPIPFSSLEGKVSPGTLQAITGRPLNHLKTMSAVQAAVFPRLPALAEPYDPLTSKDAAPRDLLVKAKTGTGKTLGFLVPAIEARLKQLALVRKKAMADAGAEQDQRFGDRAEREYARRAVGTLIISPTRELATQIANEAMKLTTFQPGFEVKLFVGGVSKGGQMRSWNRGRRDIVVATPGRLLDLLKSEPEVAAGIRETKQVRSVFL
jgi:ATP-dependent RNA helicase MSS116, mitochondrial